MNKIVKKEHLQNCKKNIYKNVQWKLRHNVHIREVSPLERCPYYRSPLRKGVITKKLSLLRRCLS